MYQRSKERSERSAYGHQEDILDLFSLLESCDLETADSVKNVIYENLSATKDSRLLHGLVDYYLAVQSQRSLDILLRLKDPHDKHLFDKITEHMKNESSRYQALQFLCTLVYKQPSWLHKIANHRIMNTLLHLLKTDLNAPNLMSALFIIICLLPMIPSQFGPYLLETFEIFSRLVAWNVKKPSAISETYVLHLQIGIYSLFHKLYGMFPCNFLAYLRSYYGGRDYNEDNFKVFTVFIKPMLERVRLHPLLVTASKETELSANRWKKMAYHDIIVECATISLDAVEGTLEGLRSKNHSLSSVSRIHNVQDSMQYISFSSQSSTVSVTVEQGSIVNESVSSNQEAVWSSAHACGFSTPPQISANSTSPLPVKNEVELKNLSTHLSVDETMPLDFAVEAKPELLKTDLFSQEKPLLKTFSKDSKSTDSDAGLSVEDSEKAEQCIAQKDLSQSSTRNKKDVSEFNMLNSEVEKSILQAVEAREDEIDKEVSELTSSQNILKKDSPMEVRHDTPFCSTTQNLTDEPDNLQKSTVSSSGRSDSLTKSNDDDVDEMYNSIQENDMVAYVPAFNRYRYFSHCGPPPDIPVERAMKRKNFRSRSCPPEWFPIVKNVADVALNCEKSVLDSEAAVVTCSSSVITTSSAFVPLTNTAVINSGVITYEHLIPMAMEPLPDIRRSGNANLESSFSYRNALFSSLSPPELLDQYIQMGSATYLNQLNSIPITSSKTTDWTHFGGKPPPDEIAILRNQILLLHNQLLFERHRKDIHSERNRRILGRAKKSKMQEEHIVALKEQISLLENENQDLKTELLRQAKSYQKITAQKQQIEKELKSQILKFSLENNQLLFSIKKLKSLLLSQKQENDEIRAESKKCQSEFLNLKVELEMCHREMIRCQKVEKDAEFMSKQLILLQELNNNYKDKIELMKEPQMPDIGADLIKDAACIEIKDLKQKLEVKRSLIDASKSRIVELELQLSNVKSKQKDQFQMMDDMKSLHKDELDIRDECIADLRKVAVEKDAYILELQKEVETLNERLNMLQKHQNDSSNSCNTANELPKHEICQTAHSCAQGSSSDTAVHESDDLQP